MPSIEFLKKQRGALCRIPCAIVHVNNISKHSKKKPTYALTSGAELTHFFIPSRNNPSLHIWTKASGEEYDISKPVDHFSTIWSAYDKDYATIHDLSTGCSSRRSRSTRLRHGCLERRSRLLLVVRRNLMSVPVAVAHSRIYRGVIRKTTEPILQRGGSDVFMGCLIPTRS